MMDSEQWKEFADGYWISSHGRVYAGPRKVRCGPRTGPHMRLKRGRILGMNLSPTGYYRVNIYRKIVHVHSLVAKAFIGDPPTPDATVNHIDLDKTNNRVENLEWVSSGDNVRHAWESGAHKWMKGVRCIETGEVFATSKEAADSRGLARGNLCSHLKGRQKTFGGYTWEYIDWPKREDRAA